MADENKIRDTADAVKGIVEAVPVYQDVVQPAAREVGTALQTVAKTLHVILAPVSGLVWGYEKIKDFVGDKVAEKLREVPTEQMHAPEPNVAGPALEALRYTGYQESLRDMYASLLATSIDEQTSTQAHPAFVEIIRQMSPDEALMIKFLWSQISVPKIDLRAEEKNSHLGHWLCRNFSLLPHEAGCSAPELGPNYLNNLARLGIVELRETYRLQGVGGKDLYVPLLEFPKIKSLIDQLKESPNQKPAIDHGAIILTELGRQFCYACVDENTHSRNGG
jgi:hypothetical protein